METLKEFKKLKKAILKLAAPSSNPDNYVDLEEALDRSEYDIKVATSKVDKGEQI